MTAVTTSQLTWNVLHAGGLKMRVKIYTDTLNHIQYICDSDPGTALTDKLWKIRKLQNDVNDDLVDQYVA
jgi:hypothetical protein